MELSKMKIEQLNKQPMIETKITKAKGWVIYTTKIVDIKPVSYLKRIVNN